VRGAVLPLFGEAEPLLDILKTEPLN